MPLPRPRRRLELATDAEYARCRAAVLEFLYARHRVPAARCLRAHMTEFDDQQKQWLQGFVSGLEARKAADKLANRSAAAAAPSNLDALQTAAQDRALAAGGKLVAEETAKRQRHPLDRMDEVSGRAKAGQFPKGMDVFLTKYQGLFYVAPAQDSFMCRLRIPNGILSAWQFRGLADAADSFGGGYADVTTRANLQIREIGAAHAVDLLNAVQALGLTARGSGADNIRNITGSPTAGIDPQELIDTRPLCSAMHHYILNHREMYGLPRKFNIAFDGGGRVPTLEDTNDIGFVACQVTRRHRARHLLPSAARRHHRPSRFRLRDRRPAEARRVRGRRGRRRARLRAPRRSHQPPEGAAEIRARPHGPRRLRGGGREGVRPAAAPRRRSE